MAIAFAYPKAKHKRRLTPPQFNDYTKYKPYLSDEFNARCVYCRALEVVKGVEAFGVDHYRPKKRFSSLETKYENLFYACNRCNSWKGTFWPSSAEVAAGCIIPNPCDHVMFEHLRYRSGHVDAMSAPGHWTIGCLDLNDPQAIKARAAFAVALDALESKLIVAKKTRDTARKMAKAASAVDKPRLESLLSQAEENVAKLQAAYDLYAS